MSIADNVIINIGEHTALVKDQSVEFTSVEWLVMDTLVSHRGRIVTVKTLNERLAEIAQSSDSLVHETVNRLRNKIGDSQHTPAIILAEYGCGYRLKGPN